MFGRIQSGEASPEEIRAYYAERRAISRDYLELAEIVLEEQGETLPERDRGLFELSVSLHRARLRQIDRDESDVRRCLAPDGLPLLLSSSARARAQVYEVAGIVDGHLRVSRPARGAGRVGAGNQRFPALPVHAYSR